MIISTTDRVEGYEVGKIIGVVHSSTVRGTVWTKDILSRIKDVFGGKATGYEKELDRMVRDAIDKLLKVADKVGADAIVGVKISLSSIPTKSFGFFLVVATGTAVKLKKEVAIG